MKYIKLILFLLLFDFTAAAEQKITLQLSWLHQFQFAGYYMAEELGLYKDAGIELEIKEFSFSTSLSDTIKNADADFAIGRSSLLIDKANGDDVVALGAIFQVSPMVLLVRDDSGIDSIQDLKDKKVMITSDARDAAAIIAMLNSRQITLDKIQVQPHSFNLDDLINRKTDAMASYISNEPIVLKDKGVGYKIFHPKDYGFDFYSDILFTSSKFIKNNPHLTKSFFEATEKGWDYAFDNISQAAKIIHEKYNTQNKSLQHLIEEGKALKELAYQYSDNGRIGCLDKDKLQRIVDAYKIFGLIDKDVNLDEFVYEDNHNKNVKLNLSENDLYLLVIIAVLLLLGCISLLFYVIVKRKWLMTKKVLESEITNKTAELEKLTYIDFLTNAKNRKAYKEKIEELISLNRRYHSLFSLALFDIDDFKQINDTYGHRVGDNVLIDITKLVQSHIRENDLFFRIGGEEFALLLSQTSLDDAKIVVEKIRKSVEDDLGTIDNKTVTVSIGLGEVHEGDDEDTLYKRVDALLYESKENGKNRISV
ncbi:ABC transporter substrate-binding protein [Campylobacterota bacterium]